MFSDITLTREMMTSKCIMQIPWDAIKGEVGYWGYSPVTNNTRNTESVFPVYRL